MPRSARIVPGSDSLESAQKEIRLFFQEGEMFSYERSIDPWVFE